MKHATSARAESLSRLDWWEQERIVEARAVVCGCGALGNEVAKNLALFGWGHVILVDMDVIEEGNLSRSILFRSDSVGQPKATVVAEAMGEINPGCRPLGVVAKLQDKVGAGLLAAADVVLGCLDSVDARLELGLLCAEADVLYLDGGLSPWEGSVTAYRPGASGGVCIGCGIGRAEMRDLTLRRSCAVHARRAEASAGVPTTPVTASVVGALMVQEALRSLFRQRLLPRWGDVLPPGSCLRYHAGTATLSRYALPANPECRYHPKPQPAPLVFSPDAAWAEVECAFSESPTAGVHYYFPRGLWRSTGPSGRTRVSAVPETPGLNEAGAEILWEPINQIPQGSRWLMPPTLKDFGLPDGGGFHVFVSDEERLEERTVRLHPTFWERTIASPAVATPAHA